MAFQRWPFPLLWLFAFTTFAFLPLQIRVPVTEIRRISSFYVRSCYFLKIITQKCKQKFCLLQRVDVADARSVLCDKRILEIVCLNNICNSSRCSAEKLRRFIGECANMRICMRMCNRRILAYSHIRTFAYWHIGIFECANMPMCEYASNLTDVIQEVLYSRRRHQTLASDSL